MDIILANNLALLPPTNEYNITIFLEKATLSWFFWIYQYIVYDVNNNLLDIVFWFFMCTKKAKICGYKKIPTKNKGFCEHRNETRFFTLNKTPPQP